MRKFVSLFIFCFILFVTSSCHLIKGTTLHYAVVKKKLDVGCWMLDEKKSASAKNFVAQKFSLKNLSENNISCRSSSSSFGGDRGGCYFPADTTAKKITPKKHHPKKQHDFVLLRGCTGCLPVVGIFIGTLGLYLVTQSFAFSLLWILLMALIISLFIGLYLHFIRKSKSEKYLRNNDY